MGRRWSDVDGGREGERVPDKPMVALDRALNVLLALAAGGAAGVTGLSRQLGYPKAATFRILRTLQPRGFVHFDPATQTYALGVALLELAGKVRGRESVADIACPYLVDLANQAGEQAGLAVIKESCALIVKEARPEHGSLLNVDFGPTAPLHCSALGKVLLAYAPPELVERVERGGLKRCTANTIVSVTALEAELARIRQRGWAVDAEELEVGLYCVAAPVVGAGGSVVAAVSVSGPTMRVKGALDAIIPQVCDAALAISSRLGHVAAARPAPLSPGAIPGAAGAGRADEPLEQRREARP